MSKKSKIAVDRRGFLFVDGVKVGRTCPNADGTTRIQFWDKCPRRSTKRGKRTVEVSVDQLHDALTPPPLTKGKNSVE